MSPERTILQYFIDKLIGYQPEYGYQQPQFGRGKSFVSIFAGNEDLQIYNGQAPVEGKMPLEFYVCYFVGGDMPNGEWYDYTHDVINTILDNPQDRASAEWFWWDQTVATLDRNTALRRFDGAQEDSRGFVVARLDLEINYLTRGPRT
jgi:hypothetical protein